MASTQDADRIVARAQEICAAKDITEHIEHIRYEGEPGLTQERFDYIVNWLVSITA